MLLPQSACTVFDGRLVVEFILADYLHAQLARPPRGPRLPVAGYEGLRELVPTPLSQRRVRREESPFLKPDQRLIIGGSLILLEQWGCPKERGHGPGFNGDSPFEQKRNISSG